MTRPRATGGSAVTTQRRSDDSVWQRYLALRDKAEADWRLLARLADHMATEFGTDSPYGGDIDALTTAFDTATTRTRDAVTAYWSWNAQHLS